MSQGEEDHPIQFHSEDISFEPEHPEKIRTWLAEVVASEAGELVQLNIVFCSDEYLYKLNVEYLQHDTYTDIITFPYQKDAVEGDLFISIDRLRENSLQYNVPFPRELYRVILHGLLHLLGYSDKSPADKLKMVEKENFYLKMMT
jgi:rRNA maturation RNase YbeY